MISLKIWYGRLLGVLGLGGVFWQRKTSFIRSFEKSRLKLTIHSILIDVHRISSCGYMKWASFERLLNNYSIFCLSELVDIWNLQWKWLFCLKWGVNEVDTISHSRDLIWPSLWRFRRFLAVFGRKMRSFEKWGVNDVYRTSRSWDIRFASFGRFWAFFGRRPPPGCDHRPDL